MMSVRRPSVRLWRQGWTSCLAGPRHHTFHGPSLGLPSLPIPPSLPLRRRSP